MIGLEPPKGLFARLCEMLRREAIAATQMLDNKADRLTWGVSGAAPHKERGDIAALHGCRDVLGHVFWDEAAHLPFGK